MIIYNSMRTGQAHDNDEDRLTSLENANLNNRLITLENQNLSLRITALEDWKNNEPDEHTLLLLRSDVKDESKYHNVIIPHNVKSSNLCMRDGRNSLRFVEGMQSYLSLFKNFLTGTAPFTIEYWCYYIKDLSGGATYHQPQSHNGNWQGMLLGYSGGSHMYVGNNDDWNVFANVNIWSITANNWIHCALCREGSSWKAYTNGTLTWSATNNAGFPIESEYETWIGHYHQLAYFIGYLQDYRISNIARYSNNFTPPQRL